MDDFPDLSEVLALTALSNFRPHSYLVPLIKKSGIRTEILPLMMHASRDLSTNTANAEVIDLLIKQREDPELAEVPSELPSLDGLLDIHIKILRSIPTSATPSIPRKRRLSMNGIKPIPENIDSLNPGYWSGKNGSLAKRHESTFSGNSASLENLTTSKSTENTGVKISVEVEDGALQNLSIHDRTQLFLQIRQWAAGEIKLDSAQLLDLQMKCINYLAFLIDLPQDQAWIQNTVDACDALLTIMINSTDKKHHLELYVETAISALDGLRLAGSVTAMDCMDFMDLLRNFNTFIQKLRFSEQLLTRLEYFCINCFFSQAVILDRCRDSVMAILVAIFTDYPSQRGFIITEVIALTLKHILYPETKGITREGTLPQPVTSMILQLIESSGDFHRNTKNREGEQIKEFVLLNQEILRVTDSIVEYLIEQLRTSFAEYKPVASAIIDDVCQLLSSADSPAACVFANQLASRLILLVDLKASVSSFELYALESLGKIATEIAKLLATNPQFSKLEAEISSISHFEQCCDSILAYFMESNSVKSKALFFHVRSVNLFCSLKESIAEEKSKSIIGSAADNNVDLKLTEVLERQMKFSRETWAAPSKGEVRLQASTVSILALQELSGVFEKAMDLLANCLGSNKIKVSVKAITVLALIIEWKGDLLLNAQINSAVSGILANGAPSSRFAAINILAQYLQNHSELATAYSDAICKLASDESLLVRKRVLKLLQDMYYMISEQSIRSNIMATIATLLADLEASIAKLALEIVESIWFKDILGDEEFQIFMDVATSRTSLRRDLIDLMHSLIKSSKAGSILEVLRADLESACEVIIENSLSPGTDEEEKALRLVSVLQEAQTDLVSQSHLEAISTSILHPTTRNNDSFNISLGILRRALEQSVVVRLSFKSSLYDSILASLTRMTPKELREGVRILDLISHLLVHRTRLMNALISSMRLLIHFLGNPSEMNPLKTCRLANILGAFGLECNLVDSRSQFEIAKVGIGEGETVTSLIMRYLTQLSRSTFHFKVRSAAMRNLMIIASAHPKLLVSGLVFNSFDEALDLEETLKVAVIESIESFLAKSIALMDEINDEASLEKAFAENSKTDFRDAICANLTQRYLSVIQEICLSGSRATSVSAIRCLQLFHSLGYANPRVIIPTVIAMEASPYKEAKQIASQLHSEIFDKHQSLADSSYGEGISLASKYLNRVGPKAHLREVLFLRMLFAVAGKTYMGKKKLVASLVKALDFNIKIQTVEQGIEQRNLLIFVAVNILALRISTMDEVYYLLFNLNRTITNRGFDLLELLSSGTPSEDGIDVILAQSGLALIFLYKLLIRAYSVNTSMLEDYVPDKPNVELRQSPPVIDVIDYPLGNLDLNISPEVRGKSRRVVQRFVSEMSSYGV